MIRQWHMLRLVPRYPSKVTVQAIRANLLGDGFEVTERTIQRDLNELSAVFPLTVDNRERLFGWSWQKDAPNLDLPGLSIPASVALVMAEQQLANLLPTCIVEQLRTYFASAHLRLNAEPRPHRGRSWLDKVRDLPPVNSTMRILVKSVAKADLLSFGRLAK